MDRVIVYDGALPQTTDILNSNKFAMIAQAFQNRAILGSTTVVAGLACTATSPTADLHVTIGVGSIYQMDPTDAAAYGDLGVDNNNILKQGMLQSPAVLSITPPVTAGFSQVYLVEAILNDVDAGLLVLSYYNSANPASPFSGPANSGTSNFTSRTCPCVIALKAGIPATTGTQATPSPDLGFVPLYAITVANGQTQITSGNIVQVGTAPFFPTLPSVPTGVLDNSWSYANDTGAVNAMVVTLSPIPAAYVAGMQLKVKAANTITSTTVNINVNGLGNVRLKRASGADPIFTPTPDITSGQIVDLIYDGVNFQIANYLGIASGAVTNNFNAVGAPYVLDTGTVNAIVATFSPAITSGQQVAGLLIAVKLANTITGACTINVNALGAKALMTGDLMAPPYNVYVVGEILLLFYDGTQYQIVNSSSLTFRKPAANTTIFVNTTTGSDTLYDGTSASVGTGTSGPLKTIQKAVNVAFNYAPSQFTITVQVAAGTYNEFVQTPSYAGPNIIINGASTGSVTVNGGTGNTFTVLGPNTMTVQNLTATHNTTPSTTIFTAAGSGANLFVTGCVSGPACNVFEGFAGGRVVPSNHTFSGNVTSSIYLALFNGVCEIPSSPNVHTFSTPISVGVVASAGGGGSIIVDNIPGVPPLSYVNPGFVSGQKYVASGNGTINGVGALPNFFPGTIAGATSAGGQYV